jgi:serine/threonine-protein kinase
MVPPSVQRIDKFDVLRRIGRGGMGSVYLARDPDIDRLVAIKLLNDGFDEDDLRGRFTAEARSASALRHTNIVTIFHTGTFLDRPFIVMEYVEGETFADIIASGRPVPLAAKLQLLDELLAGLQYAHTKGIVHRDIKPSNVMVDADGVVRILDFGIARLGHGGLTKSGVVLGTLNYMSPEQLAGTSLDARADIFSAGLVAYELLTSTPAFPQAFPEVLRQISFEHPPPLDQVSPGIDAALVRIVERCYAKQPDDRYPDCGAVRRDLDAVRKAIGPSIVEEPTAIRPAATAVKPSISNFGETQVIPRPATAPAVAAPPPTQAPVSAAAPPVTTPIAAPRSPTMLVGATAVVVLLIAGTLWVMTRPGNETNTPASVVTETPLPTPAPAPAPAAAPTPAPTPAPAAPAVTESAKPNVEPARSRADDRLLAELETSRERASGARRRAIRANGRGTQAYAVGDVRVGDGERFATLGQLDEAVRAFVDAVRRFEEAEKSAPPPTPVRVGGSVPAPKLIKRVSPEYPIAALNARQQGVVILEALIGITGKVTDVKVLRSIAGLDTAAVDAVRQWEYAPMVVDDVAVPVISSVAVEFKLTAPSPVRVGGTIKPPAQTKRVNPPYPAEAQAKNVQGVVIMEATIGTDGKVLDVRVLRSIPLLDQAALDAVRQWEYAPTVVNGIPVPVVMTVTLNFTLTPAAPPAAAPPPK